MNGAFSPAAAGLAGPLAELLIRRDIAELALAPAVDADRVRQVSERWEVTDDVTRALVDTWHRFDLADRTPLSVWAERREQPIVVTGAVPVLRRSRRRRGLARVFRRGGARTERWS